MIKIFQKRGIGILQDIPKYDFFSTPDHAVLSEFTEVKVTLKTKNLLCRTRALGYKDNRPVGWDE